MTDWANEYRHTRERIAGLLDARPQADFHRIVPACPDWTVHDVVAHMSGLAFALGNGHLPGADLQGWIDSLVDARRGATMADLLAEWRAADAAVASGQLVYDAVAHEHDIRHALGEPGARDTSSVVASLEPMTTLLARDLDAKGAGAIELSTGSRRWVAGSGEPVASIELAPFEMLRVFGSRRSEAQLRALPWQGDYEAILPALAHFPLPVADIDE